MRVWAFESIAFELHYLGFSSCQISTLKLRLGHSWTGDSATNADPTFSAIIDYRNINYEFT